MDKNKLERLLIIGYSFPPVCGECLHAEFPQSNWGTCALHKYFHEKHKETRQMSIHKFGTCRYHEAEKCTETEDFKEYLKR